MRLSLKWLVLVLMAVLPGLDAHAVTHNTAAPVTAFLRRDIADPTLYELIFVDLLNDETTSLIVRGERFTVAGGTVLYYDTARGQVMRATPAGQTAPHPFMQPDAVGSGVTRIDWAATRDGKLLAWTQATTDPAGRIATITWVSGADGSDRRILFADGPREDGLRVLPVAFSTSRTRLFMDYQPDGLTAITPYPQYAGLFALDLAATEALPQFLPGEPGDFTGAGFGAGYFLRLALTPDLAAFDVRAHNLDSGLEWTIPALRLRGFSQAGDFLVSPDGRYTVYALSQITGFGTPNQAVQTVFMLVDLSGMSQRSLTDPITEYVRPVAWTDDNSAVMFTSPQRDGTWKISLSDGRLIKVADATYLGVLRVE